MCNIIINSVQLTIATTNLFLKKTKKEELAVV